MQSQSASWFDLCIASQFAPGGLRVQFCKQLCKWEKSSPPLVQTLTSSSVLRAWSSTPHPGKITWKWWPFPNFTWPQRQCLISLCYSESRWTTGKESRDLLSTHLLLLSLNFPGQHISIFFSTEREKRKPHSSTLSLKSGSCKIILKGISCLLKEETHSQPTLLHWLIQ